MELVQVVRRVVERQVRPAQMGSTTTAADRGSAASRGGGNCFLMRMASDGSLMTRGVYGRGRYGGERYLRTGR